MLLEVHMVKSTDLRFTRPVLGFEVFRRANSSPSTAAKDPLARDTIFAPTRMPVVGRI